ncbi:hypothetical protein [Streptomyces chartreusis]|uniref:hypothetical protein n=1 Tax=Streptomyces chartreusis TaxID=1969 RepID=UPI00362EE920
MTSAVLGLPSPAAAADSLLDASTVTFGGTPDQKIFTTRKVHVPAGGGLGVYGKNTNSGFTTATRLTFRVYRDDGADVTNQFSVNFLNDGDVINQRVPVSAAHGYYIWAKCVLVIYNSFTDCDGTFTISSWG